MNRKHMILAALLGVLALCMLYAYLATPRLEKAPPKSASKRTRSAVAKAPDKLQSKVSQDHIDFTFLKAEEQEFPGATRDVFRFVQRRPQPTAVVIKEPVIKEPEIQEPPPVVIEEPMVPIEVVQQALAQFTFLGFLDKGGEKTVFLSSEGSLFLAKRGERFGLDLEFTVEDISGDLLLVRPEGRDFLIDIPLIEQQKLQASVSAPAHLPPVKTVSQPKSRIFNPKRRMLRPAAPQGSEEDFPGTIEENDPEGGQEVESPFKRDALEGEVNGSNQ
jgi:hypothetical protein